MNTLSAKQAKKFLAIDLDEEINSLVYLELLPNEAQVIGWKVIDLFDVNSEEKEKHLINALVNFIKEFNIPSREVYVSFHSPAVYLSRLTLPYIPPKEILNALNWQLKGKIPFPIDDIVFDYDLIKETTEADGRKLLHLIVASALKKEIEKVCSVIGKINLRPVKINLSPFYMINILSTLKDIDSQKIYAVLEIGWQTNELSLYQTNKLIFSRPLLVGIKNFISALQTSIVYSGNRLSLSSQQAYQVLKEVGLPEDVSGNWQGFPFSQIVVLMRPELEKLATELNRSLEYFVSNFQDGAVEKIFVTGPGVEINGLVKFLSENLKINIENLPIQMAGIPGDSKEISFITSALGNALSQERKVNLAPPEYRVRERVFLGKALGVGSFIIFAFFLISLFILNIKIGIYKKHINFLERQRPLINDLLAINNEINALEAIKTTSTKDNIRFDWILKGISKIIPSNVMLTELSIKGTEKLIELTGIVFFSPIPENTLTKIMKGIEDSKIFKGTNLNWIRKRSSSEEAEFKLNFNME